MDKIGSNKKKNLVEVEWRFSLLFRNNKQTHSIRLTRKFLRFLTFKFRWTYLGSKQKIIDRNKHYQNQRTFANAKQVYLCQRKTSVFMPVT